MVAKEDGLLVDIKSFWFYETIRSECLNRARGPIKLSALSLCGFSRRKRMDELSEG